MFYARYVNLCKKKQVSPSKVAIDCGFNKGSVSVWKKKFEKNEDVKPTPDILIKIADYFNVSVDYLLGNNLKQLLPEQINDGPTRLHQNIKFPYNNEEPFIATNQEKKMIMEYRTNPEVQQQVNSILNKENSFKTDDLNAKVAIFGGDGEVTDEMWEEVKSFAAYIKSKYKKD